VEVATPCGDRAAASQGRRRTSRAGTPHAIEVVRVLAREGAEVLIDIDGRQAAAWIAIPPPATVEPGDVVVVIGGVDRWWVVGSLGGPVGTRDATPPAFDTPADLRLHAPSGRIMLVAPRVWIGGGPVSIAASTVRATARSCVLRCQSVNQWVVGCVSQVLGGLYETVTGDYRRRSRAVDARAEGTMIIKGPRIRLN